MVKGIVQVADLGQDAEYVLSYGAGLDSTCLFFVIMKKGLPLTRIVFADTGDERKETYAYISYIKTIFENRGIPFHTVTSKSGRSLSARCFARRVIPSALWRWCTRDLKIRPIYSFYKKLNKPVIQYIGFDAKEKKRLKPAKGENVSSCFPLYEYGMTREDCIKFLQDEGVLVPSKSSCGFCPFASTAQWVNYYNTDKEGIYRSMAMEEQNKYFPRQKLFVIPLRQLEELIIAGLPLPKSKHDDRCGSL